MSALSSANTEQAREPIPKVAFAVRDVALILGVHRNTVYAQIKQGRIPVVYVGRKPLVPRRWIEETFGDPFSGSGLAIQH